jgi:hypothetical protein
MVIQFFCVFLKGASIDREMVFQMQSAEWSEIFEQKKFERDLICERSYNSTKTDSEKIAT